MHQRLNDDPRQLYLFGPPYLGDYEANIHPCNIHLDTDWGKLGKEWPYYRFTEQHNPECTTWNSTNTEDE